MRPDWICGTELRILIKSTQTSWVCCLQQASAEMNHNSQKQERSQKTYNTELLNCIKLSRYSICPLLDKLFINRDDLVLWLLSVEVAVQPKWLNGKNRNEVKKKKKKRTLEWQLKSWRNHWIWLTSLFMSLQYGKHYTGMVSIAGHYEESLLSKKTPWHAAGKIFCEQLKLRMNCLGWLCCHVGMRCTFLHHPSG